MKVFRTAVVAASAAIALLACGTDTPEPPAPSASAAVLPTSVAPTTAVSSASVEPTADVPTPTRTAATPTRTTAAPRPTRTTPPPPFPSTLRGKDLERIPTSRKVVALTFDAGANANGVPAILDTLAREHVRATFFLTGDFVRDFPAQSKQIAAAGHRVANHSVNHPHFPTLTDAEIRGQLSNAATTIRTTTGADPTPLFRFPYGDRDARTIATVNAAGYLPVRWTVDTLGWDGTKNGTRTASFVVNRVMAAATAGEIVLMHVGSHPTDHSTLDADALPAVISSLRAAGYAFVTLDEVLS